MTHPQRNPPEARRLGSLDFSTSAAMFVIAQPGLPGANSYHCQTSVPPAGTDHRGSWRLCGMTYLDRRPPESTEGRVQDVLRHAIGDYGRPCPKLKDGPDAVSLKTPMTLQPRRLAQARSSRSWRWQD
jgi:hypothetical protein